MQVVCVIPARLDSKRFPHKVLAQLGHQPLLKWIWDAASSIGLFSKVVFAIDDQKTAKLIESFNGSWIMTSIHCQSGTDRLVEIQSRKKISGDIWVNWQGDEPMIRKEMIDDLLQSVSNKQADIWSLQKRITTEEELTNPGIVKVVSTPTGRALYFSRAQIPYCADHGSIKNGIYYKHIGIYAYTNSALKKIARLPPSRLEETEKLEQLRFLENDLSIQMHHTKYETMGIDHPSDLKRLEKELLHSLL